VQGLLGADAQIGALLLQLPQPALPPHSLRASLRLRMGRGTGAGGFSFSYGDLPAGAIGEPGAGDGLRVCFRTHMLSRVELWYRGRAARGARLDANGRHAAATPSTCPSPSRTTTSVRGCASRTRGRRTCCGCASPAGRRAAAGAFGLGVRPPACRAATTASTTC